MSTRFFAFVTTAFLLPAVVAAQARSAADRTLAAALPPAGVLRRPDAAAQLPRRRRTTRRMSGRSRTFVPPRTPDGQPDISGLYVAIALPRGIETPLVAATNRAANRANSEYSFGVASERPRLPEGADRPAGRRRSGRRQDSADAGSAGQAQGHHLEAGAGAAPRLAACCV